MQDYYNNYAEKVNNDPTRLNALRTNIEGIASTKWLIYFLLKEFNFSYRLESRKRYIEICRE